jgi:hypothetical protein
MCCGWSDHQTYQAMNAHIWRYQDNRRNYPGYHLSADFDGCDALLRWLRRMDNGLEFRLKPVTPEVLGIPNNQHGSAKAISCALFKIKVETNLAKDHLLFSEISGRLTLECSQLQAERVIQGIEDMAKGRGDYSVGEIDPHILWFWWHPTTGYSKRRSVEAT